MTREEIKNLPEIVYLMLDKCVLADSRTKVYKRLEEACDLAIKAVEQESVIAKIRAEIEEIELNITYAENYKVGGAWGLRKALDIIDKYKAESES